MGRCGHAAGHCAALGDVCPEYRGIPSTNLSFNLFNEPAGVSEENYLAVVGEVVAAIRAEDAGRLVLCDGGRLAHARTAGNPRR